MVSKIAHTEFDKNVKAVAKQQPYVLYIWGSNTQFVYNVLVVEITACYCCVVFVISQFFIVQLFFDGFFKQMRAIMVLMIAFSHIIKPEFLTIFNSCCNPHTFLNLLSYACSVI